MSKLMDERIRERNIELAANLLEMGDLSYEKIAKATRLTLADIEEIAKELEAEKARQ